MESNGIFNIEHRSINSVRTLTQIVPIYLYGLLSMYIIVIKFSLGKVINSV